jgi:two-component system chemotaxis response regulator CheB
VALRIIGERVVLSEKMAEDARRSGRNAAAAGYYQRARELHKYIEILRRGDSQERALEHSNLLGPVRR